MQVADKLRIHAAENKHVKELARKGKSYHRFIASIVSKLGNSLLIKAPDHFSIYSVDSTDEQSSPYERTMEFISTVKEHAISERCILDFRDTKLVTAAAMVVLYAELEKVVYSSKLNHKISWSIKSPHVNKSLRSTGISRLLNRRNALVDFKNSEKLPVIKGVGKHNLEEILDHVQEKVYENRMDANTEFLFGDAVSETINNVGRHAYPNHRDEQKEWWLSCEVIGEQLYLAVYDRGVGIPHTVVEQPWFLVSLKKTYPEQYEKLMEALDETGSNFKFYAVRRLKDSELIYISMKGDVSGLKKSKHGQGSKSIKALVNDTDDGKLWVFSKKGLYVFEETDNVPQLYKLPVAFSGTLLQWNIKIR